MPWTLLNITKLVLSLSLVLLPLADLVYLIYVYHEGESLAEEVQLCCKPNTICVSGPFCSRHSESSIISVILGKNTSTREPAYICLSW